jgi:hypothetical protein
MWTQILESYLISEAAGAQKRGPFSNKKQQE